MIFGYVRTSTTEQKGSLETQEQTLRASGAEQVFIEEKSGKSLKNREALQSLLSRLRPGDVVITTKIDRLSRSLSDFVAISQLITDAGATFRCTDQHVETETAAGRLMLSMLASFAEFEREMICERVQAGVDAARASGKQLGRPRMDVSSNPKAKALKALIEAGTNISEASRQLGISRPTAHRWLDQMAA